jgi:anti-anti-sigma factor
MAGPGGSRSDGIPPTPFSVERSVRGDVVVITVRGELDMATVDRLAVLAEDVPQGSRVVVDMAELEFIDSAGIHLLLALDLRSRQEGWDLTLARPQTTVMRMLTLLKITDQIPIRDTPP